MRDTFARAVDVLLRDARSYGHSNFKIDLARRTIVRALTPDEPVTEIEKAIEAPASLEDNFRGDLMKRLRGALLLGRFASFSRTPQGRFESFLLRREKRRNEHLPIPVVLHQCIHKEDDDGNGKA